MNFLQRETLVTTIINCIFTAIFFQVALGFGQPIELGGVGKFALDMLPQTFFVGLFSTLPVTLISLKAIKSGKFGITASDFYLKFPKNIVLRVLLGAFSSLIVMGGTSFVLLAFVLPAMTISSIAGFVFKLIVSIIIALVVAPTAIRVAAVHNGR